ncbi:hypothetical protein GCM10027168_37660 [Streptomyces capparidis]
MVLKVVVACEIGFWVLLTLGLALRYLLRWRRTSAAVLVCVPLVDVVLLIATAVDLRRGATAEFQHGLAAAYIGFSVAYGHSMVKWADARFAHRFAGGPPPPKPPKYGMARARYEWRLWLRTALAAAIAVGLLQVAVWWVDAPRRTEQLEGWQGTMVRAAMIHLIIAATYTIWPKKPSEKAPEQAGDEAGDKPADLAESRRKAGI